MHSFNRDSDWDDMSSAAKLRKIRKPLVERKRRERINTSMMELKSLILHAMCKKESDYEKMEKADILEMTVHYLRTLHHARHAHAVTKFRDGFQDCATEVRRYLGSTPDVESSVRMRMHQHLSNRTFPYPEIIKPEVTKLTPALPMASPVTFLPGLYGCQETPLSSIAAVPAIQPEERNYAPPSSLPLGLPSSSATTAKFRETFVCKNSVPLGESAASAACSTTVRRNLFEHELRPVRIQSQQRLPGDETNNNNGGNRNEDARADENAWRPWK